MREWCTLPYAFARSSQHIASDLCFSRASAKMEERLRWWSVQPGTVGIRPSGEMDLGTHLAACRSASGSAGEW